jgi:hypothetical protein
MSNWQTPIVIGALDPLLTSGVLDTRDDARLIGLLVRLKKNTALLNDHCWLVNLHEYLMLGDYELRWNHRNQALDQYGTWLKWKDAVLKELDNRGYALKVEVPKLPDIEFDLSIYGPPGPIYGPPIPHDLFAGNPGYDGNPGVSGTRSATPQH